LCSELCGLCVVRPCGSAWGRKTPEKEFNAKGAEFLSPWPRSRRPWLLPGSWLLVAAAKTRLTTCPSADGLEARSYGVKKYTEAQQRQPLLSWCCWRRMRKNSYSSFSPYNNRVPIRSGLGSVSCYPRRASVVDPDASPNGSKNNSGIACFFCRDKLSGVG